jgi:hypothetical protein
MTLAAHTQEPRLAVVGRAAFGALLNHPGLQATIQIAAHFTITILLIDTARRWFDVTRTNGTVLVTIGH